MNDETLPKHAPPSPADPLGSEGTLSFDRFELDLQRGVLRSAGAEIALRPKSFLLLHHLVIHPGRLISKDELLRTLWPDVVVTEDSLVQCVGELRAALADREQRLIKTVPRRGYMLDALVQPVGPAVTPAPTAADDVAAPLPALRPSRGKVIALMLGVAVLLGGALVWWWPARSPHIDSVIAAQRAIAILPFTDLSERPSAAFAEGMAEDLSVAVAQLADTLVFGSGSTSAFTGPRADARAAGRVLGATHVLTGSVQRNGEAVLIRAQLLRTDSGALLWSERFEYSGAAHWNWQRDVTQRIANALDVRLDAAHMPPSDFAGGKPGAIEATQQGRYLIRHGKTRDDLLRARALLESALAADPDSVVAISAWGATHMQEVLQRWSTDREHQIELASKAFDRALALRPDYAMAHYGRSNVLYMRGQMDEAARACEQVLVLWPNQIYALQRLGFYRLQQGRPGEAAAPIELALRLNPLETNWAAFGHFFLGMAQFHLHRDDEAYEEMRKASAANPNNGFAWQWMASIDALHGRDELARANLATYEKLIPGHTVSSLKATEPSKNAQFWAERERFYEGLRKAGLPP